MRSVVRSSGDTPTRQSMSGFSISRFLSSRALSKSSWMNGVINLRILSSALSPRHTIKNNVVMMNGSRGVLLSAADGALTQGNMVAANAESGLFYLQAAPPERTSVRHNLVVGNAQQGAYFFDTERMILENNAWSKTISPESLSKKCRNSVDSSRTISSSMPIAGC